VPRQARRGDGTRAKLIDTALGLFAVHGYDGVTTRMLTNGARANLAAVNYHFGGKRGLYHAVIADIARRVRARLAPEAARLETAIADSNGEHEALRRAAVGFFRALITGFIGEASQRPMVGLVMREYASPTDAFPVLYENAVEPLHGAVSRLVAAAHGRSQPDRQDITEAHGLIGMCISFAIARVVLCRRLNWEDYTPERVARIAETVARMAAGALGLANAMERNGHATRRP
ncbi:MAG: CerR family C-terminal domain-containing protein, partial [Alphaproteobacteria bacterium]